MTFIAIHIEYEIKNVFDVVKMEAAEVETFEKQLYNTQIIFLVAQSIHITVTSGAFCPSPSCPHAPCLVHAGANVLFAHVCHTICV